MYNADLYNLTQSLSGAFFVGMSAVRAQEELEPLPDLVRLRAGYAESPGWYMVQAMEFDPQPLTIADLRMRDIYASERLVGALLEIMASEKWLHRLGNRYFLTAAGRALQEKLRRRVVRRLAALQPLPEKDLSHLENGLGHIIEACLESGQPPGSFCLTHSRNRAPAADAPTIMKIYHYTADFNAFRDDAHMAAWQPLGIDGRTWEAFAHVFNQSAQTAAALFDQLAYRGYSQEDYGAALTILNDKGWIAGDPDPENNGQIRFQVTEKGHLVQAEVERLTDEYFFSPWRTRSQEEIDHLIQLIEQAVNALQALGG